MIDFLVNGKRVDLDLDPSTPLLWVIREQLASRVQNTDAAWRSAAPAPCTSIEAAPWRARLAAQTAGWGKPLPKDMGRGIAVHFVFGSYSAPVAQVSVTAGRIRVQRMVCAIDCGLYVNPGIRMAEAV